MRQETVAGIVMVVIGIMLAFAPEAVWKMSFHKRPVPTLFSTVIRILGGAFLVVGFLLAVNVTK